MTTMLTIDVYDHVLGIDDYDIIFTYEIIADWIMPNMKKKRESKNICAQKYYFLISHSFENSLFCSQ